MKQALIGILAGILVLGLIFVGMYFGYNNSEIRLRNQVEAQRGKIEGSYDAMWKIIKQKAQVTDEYKDAFSEIYPELIAGRYSKGDGSLMKWVTENNPEFDTSLYKDLMEAIEVQRLTFKHDQERILDLIREHENLIHTVPACWFIKNDTSIEYTIISSTQSKYVMETGLDDDVELFGDK